MVSTCSKLNEIREGVEPETGMNGMLTTMNEYGEPVHKQN